MNVKRIIYLFSRPVPVRLAIPAAVGPVEWSKLNPAVYAEIAARLDHFVGLTDMIFPPMRPIGPLTRRFTILRFQHSTPPCKT